MAATIDAPPLIRQDLSPIIGPLPPKVETPLSPIPEPPQALQVESTAEVAPSAEKLGQLKYEAESIGRAAINRKAAEAVKTVKETHTKWSGKKGDPEAANDMSDWEKQHPAEIALATAAKLRAADTLPPDGLRLDAVGNTPYYFNEHGKKVQIQAVKKIEGDQFTCEIQVEGETTPTETTKKRGDVIDAQFLAERESISQLFGESPQEGFVDAYFSSLAREDSSFGTLDAKGVTEWDQKISQAAESMGLLQDDDLLKMYDSLNPIMENTTEEQMVAILRRREWVKNRTANRNLAEPALVIQLAEMGLAQNEELLSYQRHSLTQKQQNGEKIPLSELQELDQRAQLIEDARQSLKPEGDVAEALEGLTNGYVNEDDARAAIGQLRSGQIEDAFVTLTPDLKTNATSKVDKNYATIARKNMARKTGKRFGIAFGVILGIGYIASGALNAGDE